MNPMGMVSESLCPAASVTVRVTQKKEGPHDPSGGGD
jgi:hypothetical protein